MKEKDLVSMLQPKSIKVRATNKMLNFGLANIKSHFGVEMHFRGRTECIAITKILKKYDVNYKHHITMDGNDEVYTSECIIPIRKDTYVYVNSYTTDSKESDVQFDNIDIYIFGKKSIGFRNHVSKKIDEFRNETRLIYKASGSQSRGETISVCASEMKKRTFDTLYFNDGIEEEIKDYLDSWLKTEDIYKSRGLNYKTGILLGGCPGTGKSSIATAIASYLNCDLISIDTTTFENMAIQQLTDSINYNNKRYVVLLDEIDIIFKSRNDDDTTDAQKTRTTKLLKFLDSPESPNNVVFVATTNFANELLNPKINADAASLRKGRFDKILFIDNFNRKTAERMCRGFGMHSTEINKLLGNDTEFNPSDLQDKILDHIAHKETLEDYMDKAEIQYA